MGILSTKYSAWLFATESTVGTDAVDAAISANDNVLYQAVLSDSTIRPVPRFERQAVARASEAGVKQVYVPEYSDVVINMPLREGVGSDFQPEYHALMLAAGYDVTTSAGVSTVYNLATANDSFVTVYRYMRNLTDDNWRLRRALGTLLTLNASGEVGAEPLLNFVGQSINNAQWTDDRAYFDGDDEPVLDYAGAGYTYTGAAAVSAADPFICQNATLTWNGTTIPAQSWNLASNMRVEPLRSMANASSTVARIARDRDDGSNAVLGVNFGMTGSTLGDALDAFFTGYQADTEAAAQLVLSNGTSRVTLDVAKCQPRLPVESPNGPAMNWDVELHINGDFGSELFAENAIKWTFDAAP